MPGRTFVIVHGAWGASATWTPLAEALRGKGHRVFTPSLTGLGERRHLYSGAINLSTHIEDVVGTIECEGLEGFVLVGHSYGGMVITGVADRLADRISHIAYLDAFVPGDGESLFDFVGEEATLAQMRRAADGDGIGIPPAVRDLEAIPAHYRRFDERRGPQPLATFAERAHLSGAHARIAKRLYVLCTGGAPRPFGKAHARVKDDPSWRVETIDCGHLLQLEKTDEVADILVTFAAS